MPPWACVSSHSGTLCCELQLPCSFQTLSSVSAHLASFDKLLLAPSSMPHGLVRPSTGKSDRVPPFCPGPCWSPPPPWLLGVRCLHIAWYLFGVGVSYFFFLRNFYVLFLRLKQVNSQCGNLLPSYSRHQDNESPQADIEPPPHTPPGMVTCTDWSLTPGLPGGGEYGSESVTRI